MRASLDFPAGFYVYQLIDPRDGLPFYVGKGQRDRAWQHEREVLAGKLTGNARKVCKIQNIHRVGLSVQIEIVAQYTLESDALDHEYRLVDANPKLTNVMPGGIGPAATPAQIDARNRQRAARLAALRAKELERDVDRKCERLLQGIDSPAAKAEVEEWAETFKRNGQRLRLNPETNLALRNRRIAEEKAAAAKRLLGPYGDFTYPGVILPKTRRRRGIYNSR